MSSGSRIADIKSLNVHVPVTAVCFVHRRGEKFLLSGSGGFVSVFDLISSNELISTVNVLGSRNIHGFCLKQKVDESDLKEEICAFGERFVSAFNLKGDILNPKQFSKTPLIFHDRVMDVRWLETFKQNAIAVLLAHNEFELVDLTSRNVIKSVRCEENSVLFSGTIVDAPEMPFVIAGACMGYLYLWQPLDEESGEKVQAQLNLSNAGGLFCVAIKDDRCNLAIACEDRAIYTFKVNAASKTIEKIKTLFGHAARIWKVCWVEKHLVSAGEDCQVLLWNLTDGSVIHRFESTSNTNFFSLTVDPLEPYHLATGLSDGAVRLFNAKSFASEGVERPGDDPAFAIGSPSEHLVCLRFIDVNTIIYVNNKGKIALIHLPKTEKEEEMIQSLEMNPHYSIAVVLAVKRLGNDRFLVGVAHGVPSDITIFELSRGSSWEFYKKAEFRLPATMARVYLLSFLSGESEIPRLFASNFDVAANCVFDTEGKLHLEFNLSKMIMPSASAKAMKHFDKVAITSGLSFETKTGDLFIFGDNCGSVLAAKRFGETYQINILQIFPHIHGRDGCFSVSYSKTENLVITCGGSSSVCVFKFESGNNDSPLTLVSTVKPCSSLDYTVKRVVAKGASGREREIVAGFSQKSFVLTTIKPSQIVLTRHYCSGRNREWDLFIDDSANLTVRFAYVRQGRPYLMSPDDSIETSKEAELLPPLHGLRVHDCNFICYLPTPNAFIFALASEDATATVIAVEDRKTAVGTCGETMHILHRLAGHISGVRCVQVMKMPSDENSFLLLTGGSRGIVIAWLLTLADVGISDLTKSTFCKKIAQVSLTNEPLDAPDLPASSQSGSQLEIPKGTWRQRKIFGPPLAPDMRFMDLTVTTPSCQNADGFTVHAIAACSDATLRVFQLSLGNATIFNQILCLSEGLSFCQLKTAFLLNETKSGSGIVVSGDTGGFLNVWHWPEILHHEDDSPVKPQSIRIHQSGINALQVYKSKDVLPDDDVPFTVILTGGDDTSLAVSKIYFEESGKLSMEPLLRIDSAHSSQISGLPLREKVYKMLFRCICYPGVCYLKDISAICTSSIDQRVRFWKFGKTSDMSKQLMLAGYASCVADCSSLAVASKNCANSLSICANNSSPIACSSNEKALFLLAAGEGCQFLKVHLSACC